MKAERNGGNERGFEDDDSNPKVTGASASGVVDVEDNMRPQRLTDRDVSTKKKLKPLPVLQDQSDDEKIK